MNRFLNEEVPDEYVDLLDAIAHPIVESEAASNGKRRLRAVVVGAGLSGLIAAIRLREQGVDCLILERNAQVSGAWGSNTYPGCGVDIPSYWYSSSLLDWDWSAHFARRDEVNAYLAERDKQRAAVRYDVESRFPPEGLREKLLARLAK